MCNLNHSGEKSTIVKLFKNIPMVSIYPYIHDGAELLWRWQEDILSSCVDVSAFPAPGGLRQELWKAISCPDSQPRVSGGLPKNSESQVQSFEGTSDDCSWSSSGTQESIG